MQESQEPAYSASSPPFIFDSDMSGRLDSDPDFEFFDSSALDADTPSVFADNFAPENHSHFLGSAGAVTHKSPLPQRALLDTKLHPVVSAPSTASPAGSYQDSGSESSGYKRKSSSDSSRSALTPGDAMMADDTDMRDWKPNVTSSEGGDFDGFINPSVMNNNYEFNDKSMENDFDFDSAASSPSMFGNGNAGMDSPEMPIIKTDTPRKYTPLPKKFKSHNKANSQHSVTQSMNGLTTAGSREVSPLSAMITSHESSPSAFFNNSPSPGNAMDFVNGSMLGGGPQGAKWTGMGEFTNNGLPMQPNPQMTPRMAPSQQFQPFSSKCKLILHPTPLKSRVETQIPIKMSLYPLPPGISSLHLPTHTISKPKLLAKPTPERAPDMLELYTTLVCSSAMQNPELRKAAFERAALATRPAGSPKTESVDSSSDDDDESKPINGGDVRICPGCVTRERKRAARKKAKKVEEEECWQKYETQRVIVFNTQEVKDWQTVTAQPSTEINGDRMEPSIPEGAMQVDAPMRIACYCRHQNEKFGFQVIFTIKDYQDRLIAQEITSSIMITDDHKTHNMPPLSTQTSTGSDSPMFPGAGQFAGEGTFDMSFAPVNNLAPFRMSHSSSDLQALQRNANMQFQPSASVGTSPHASQTTSASMTPRGMSRQTSPSAPSLPVSKKRKASGSSKVPSGLAMTRLETGENTIGQSQPGPISMSTNTSAAPSPFNPTFPTFPISPEQHFGAPPMTGVPPQFNTGPPTPNSNDQMLFSNANRSQSMENLALQQLYSTPGSAIPSRVSSPNGTRNPVQAYQQQQQAQIAQAVANGMYGLPLSLNPHRPPTIHKLIPNEGPRAGGIEVTCLGSGFCQGLEVMFGESKATTTTYWGETSLVCLLPPSAFAGMVPVTFKHQHQQQHMQPYPTPPMPNSQAFFKYVDDDELQILRTALSVLGHKMTGKMEDVRELARRIVGNENALWGAPTGQPPSGGSGQAPFNAAAFGMDVEATLLKCLDLMDLDDSPNMPRYNMRRASGQTMLHLACSLGLHRFAAALLARGANPEPRDKGGFTPMHFAALHNHPQIVRRLMLSGGDPTIRSLQGYTPANMATSREVLQATRRIEHHSRTRSGGSLRSRTNSATSLRSVWEPTSTPSQVGDYEDSSDDSEDDNEFEDEDADAADVWMKSRRPQSRIQSRRPSTQFLSTQEGEEDEQDPVLDLPSERQPSPTAAMVAWRDQITTQIQQIQQAMHNNLPNLPQIPQMQMPRFDMMRAPTLPDYQAYLPTTPMVRRISNLVGTNRPASPKESTQVDYRWWDLFSGTNPAAPPAYEDIFPQGELDAKLASATQAAADTVADNKCAEIFDLETETVAESSTTAANRPKSRLETVRIGQGKTISREQQDRLIEEHKEKLKRLSRDRNLFFIWIPLLLIIILAMLYNNRDPNGWSWPKMRNLFSSIRIGNHANVPVAQAAAPVEGRIVEIV